MFDNAHRNAPHNANMVPAGRHRSLFGMVHLSTAMKVIILIGLLVIIALCVLEGLYFRRALIVMVLPLAVSAFTTAAMCQGHPHLVWPIIGISFFHLFLDAYATLVFLFFFFFKPLYIIMVLNWAFDTLHTTKTPSFYMHCAAVFATLVVFFAFNLWQLITAVRFKTYLDELSSYSSATESTERSGSETSNVIATNGITPPSIAEQRQNGIYSPQPQCKLLNEPPIVLLSGGGTGNRYCTNGLCPPASPGSQRSARSAQLRVPQPELTVNRSPLVHQQQVRRPASSMGEPYQQQQRQQFGTKNGGRKNF